jgi:hypothetical protein
LRAVGVGSAAGSDQSSIVVISKFECLLFRYWQASQVGSSIEQAMTGGGAISSGEDNIPVADTALSLPSVPFSVDFSTCVADCVRK